MRIRNTKKYEEAEKEPKPKINKTTKCPKCGCEEYSNPCGVDYKICLDCNQEWFSDIDYTKRCTNCLGEEINSDGTCVTCGWKQVKTKKDLNDIEVHTPPD